MNQNHDRKAKFLKHFHLKEAWLIFFILGIIMMDYPFICIFDKPRLLPIGMPTLFLYLYVGWIISIFIIYIFVRAIESGNDNHHGERH